MQAIVKRDIAYVAVFVQAALCESIEGVNVNDEDKLP